MNADTGIQERVFSLLADPAKHPDVQRIDTHGASVFLDGDRVLKVKRAVRFPYMDYSTLEKRKAACEEEIRINRPLAPQIYRRVVPITENAEGFLEIDGTGPAVEFAVEMTRFDERRTFDHLAKSGPIKSEITEAMADAIAASHAIAPLADAEPWIKSIPPIIEGDSRAFLAAGIFSSDDIEELARVTLSAFARVRELLQQRGKLGYVRRCHGDLHLANIVLIDSRPVLFDAIEFDPVMASIDVLYDLAFTMMDFIHYGRRDAANALLNRYLVTTSPGNLDALAALPLFLSLRAAIRANVQLARLGRPHCDSADATDSATAYFNLARRLIRPPPPRLIAIGGLSGTGKSVLARALAPDVMPEPGAVLLRTDVLRKQRFQVGELDRLPDSAYQPEITAQVYGTLTDRASRILSHGHSVIADGVFADPSERSAIRDVARRLGIPFTGFFLAADQATRMSRVSHRTNDASDATAEVAGRQANYDIGTMDWSIIDASGTSPQTLAQCRQLLFPGDQAIP